VSKRYHRLVALKRREEGQTMAEYGVVLAVLTLGVLAAMTLLATNIEAGLRAIADFLN
jgi:Flp pilus assembly pilin Flp